MRLCAFKTCTLSFFIVYVCVRVSPFPLKLSTLLEVYARVGETLLELLHGFLHAAGCSLQEKYRYIFFMGGGITHMNPSWRASARRKCALYRNRLKLTQIPQQVWVVFLFFVFCFPLQKLPGRPKSLNTAQTADACKIPGETQKRLVWKMTHSFDLTPARVVGLCRDRNHFTWAVFFVFFLFFFYMSAYLTCDVMRGGQLWEVHHK